jgi:hypothetical protein
MATVNSGVVQKFLATVSDIIALKINDDPSLKLAVPSNIVKVYYDYATTDKLSVDEAMTMLERQHDLLSTSLITDVDVASDVFLNNTKTSDNLQNFISKNFDYSITHNIIIPFKTNPADPDSETELFYFNIDEVNRVTSVPGDGIFLFDRVEIKNKSKDAFTARSNYHVTLNVAFKFFEDLSDKNIIARKVGDPDTTKEIPLLSILYKYFRLPTTAVGRESLRDISDRDPDGIYLNQVLKFENNYYFKNAARNIDRELHRTFRLTYYKHEFEVFKSDDPLLKEFENQLTMQFISYEADLVSKPGRDKKLPSLTNNVYNLLDPATPDTLDTGTAYSYSYGTTTYSKDYATSFQYIKDVNETLSALRRQINCKILYDNRMAIGAADASDYADYANVNLADVREKVTKLSEVLITAKFEIQRSLVNSLINKTTFYSIATKYEVLGDYNRIDILYDMWKNFSTIGAATSVFAGGTTATTFLPKTTPYALVTGAVIGVGLYSAQLYAQAAEGHYTSIDRSVSDLNLIRQRIRAEPNPIKKLTPTEVSNLFNIGEQRAMKKSARKPIKGYGLGLGSDLGDFKDAIEAATISDKKSKRELESRTLALSGLIDAEEATDPSKLTKDIEVPFILFGDILKILNITEPNSILYIGGKLIDNLTFRIADKYSYVNFFDYPISANLYFKFLKDYILDVDRDLHYSSELFLRDAYDNLLKKIVMRSDGSIQTIYKNYLPANLQLSMSTHVDDRALRELDPLLGKEVNVGNLDFFTPIKRNLARSKNIQYKVSGLRDLKTLYFLCSDEELDKYDFYTNFKTWVDDYNVGKPPEEVLQNSNLCSFEFQNYIVREHLIPCVLIRSTGNDETILKKKNMSFSRIDNPNLQTGNIIDNASFMRLPYQFKSQFHIYLSFFLDIGSLIFISPPAGRRGADNNKYGFAGLYVIKESNLVYYFQRFKNDDVSLPNEEGSYDLGGYLLAYGDGESPTKTEDVRGSTTSDCSDPILAATTPALANNYARLFGEVTLK